MSVKHFGKSETEHIETEQIMKILFEDQSKLDDSILDAEFVDHIRKETETALTSSSCRFMFNAKVRQFLDLKPDCGVLYVQGDTYFDLGLQFNFNDGTTLIIRENQYFYFILELEKQITNYLKFSQNLGESFSMADSLILQDIRAEEIARWILERKRKIK